MVDPVRTQYLYFLYVLMVGISATLFSTPPPHPPHPGQDSHKSAHSVRSEVGWEEMRFVLILSLTITVSLGKPNFGFARLMQCEVFKVYIIITTTKFAS